MLHINVIELIKQYGCTYQNKIRSVNIPWITIYFIKWENLSYDKPRWDHCGDERAHTEINVWWSVCGDGLAHTEISVWWRPCVHWDQCVVTGVRTYTEISVWWQACARWDQCVVTGVRTTLMLTNLLCCWHSTAATCCRSLRSSAATRCFFMETSQFILTERDNVFLEIFSLRTLESLRSAN